MFHTKQTGKRLRQSKEFRSSNKRYLSLIKYNRTMVLQHDKPFTVYANYQSAVDKAVKRNVIKAGKGSKLKSKIIAKLSAKTNRVSDAAA